MAKWIPLVDAYKASLVRPTQFIDYRADKGIFYSKKFSEIRQIFKYTTETKLAWNSFMYTDGKIWLISSMGTEVRLTLFADDVMCGDNRLKEYAECLYSNKSLHAKGRPFTAQVYEVLPNEIPEVNGVWVGNPEATSYNERMFVIGKDNKLEQGILGERLTKVCRPATEFELTSGSSVLKPTDMCFNMHPVATRKILCEHVNCERGRTTARMRPVVELPDDILVRVEDDRFDGSSPEKALQIKSATEKSADAFSDELDNYLKLLKISGNHMDKTELATAMHKISEIQQKIYELQLPF